MNAAAGRLDPELAEAIVTVDPKAMVGDPHRDLGAVQIARPAAT